MTMVERVTSIIDVFDDPATGLSLDEVASRAALPRSTTHRILDHLVRQQWLRHSDTGYGLGARAISWGAGEAADLRLRQCAAPSLHRLFVGTGVVAHLGVLVGTRGAFEVMHVDKLGGPSADSVPTAVGTTVCAYRSALGLAVLAKLPPEDIGGAPIPDLHRVRRAGGLVKYSDYGPGLTSVAATVDARAAIGIVLPDNRSGEQFLPLVVDAAAQIRRALG